MLDRAAHLASSDHVDGRAAASSRVARAPTGAVPPIARADKALVTMISLASDCTTPWAA